MRVLVLSDPDVVSFYRGHGRMLHEGAELVFPHTKGHIDWLDLERCDAVLIPRAASATQAEVCTLVKAAGKRLILDYDDALFSLPMSNSCFLEYRSLAEYVVKCIFLADEIHFSTPAVQQDIMDGAVAVAGEKPRAVTRIIRNRAAFLTGAETWNAYSDLGVWRGSATHIRDVDCHLQSIITHVKDSGIRCFKFFGVPHDELAEALISMNVEVQAVGALPVHIYMQALRDCTPKYLYTPLVKCLFNDAKSDIAALEALAAGALPVVFGDPAEFSWVTGDFEQCMVAARERR